MKIYYKNAGSGSLLVRVGLQKFTLTPGVNTVPDDAGEEILKKGIKGISTDDEARAAKSEKVAALNDNAALKAEIAELKKQVAKLQLIAAQVPPAPDAEKPKRGRPAKSDSVDTTS